jgi:tRNA threonylcarbamoyladenosine biosynthesis protein TsaE
MATYISHSPAETRDLGELWAGAVAAGWVIGLCGDLGSGKTELVKGLAIGLGIPARVHSPTFTLVNVYTGGSETLFHLDLYRLETREQILAAGLEEYFNPVGVTVVEWAERWYGHSPGSRPLSPSTEQPVSIHRQQVLRWVEIVTLSDTERRFVYEDFGA